MDDRNPKQRRAERFAEVWETSDSVEEVAARLRISPQRAWQLSLQLWRIGVNLKRMSPPRQS